MVDPNRLVMDNVLERLHEEIEEHDWLTLSKEIEVQTSTLPSTHSGTLRNGTKEVFPSVCA